MSLILGVHVAKSSKVLDDKKDRTMHDAIKQDIDTLELNAAQIFTHGPRFMNENAMDHKQVVDATADLDLTVHSAYMSVGIWKVNEDNWKTKQSQGHIERIVAHLRVCKKIGAWGLVVHITKQHPDDVAFAMKKLRPYAKKYGVKILLEMVANKADAIKTYETPEKIDNLTELIGAKETWWGWCVDTAHLWGAGVDIKYYKSMKDWLQRITHKKKICMFHLNGSSAARGSGKDKHEIPFCSQDVMWHSVDPSNSGLRAVIEFAVPRNCTVICEINRGTRNQVIRGLEIIKRIGLKIENDLMRNVSGDGNNDNDTNMSESTTETS